MSLNLRQRHSCRLPFPPSFEPTVLMITQLEAHNEYHREYACFKLCHKYFCRYHYD